MQNTLSAINKPIVMPCVLFNENYAEQFASKIMTCQMDGDSMMPTIQPGEVVAFIGCSGVISTPGIYVFSRDVFGRRCVFIKRVEPIADSALKIISDNHYYKVFKLNADEQSDMQIHGRVVASFSVRHLA